MDGNDADIEACEIGLAASRDYAGEKGCAEWWDNYYECVVDQSSCNNDVYSISAGDCEDEQQDCGSCGCGLSVSGPSGGGEQ